MKLRVQCLVARDGSPLSPEAAADESQTKEIPIPNAQHATVISLRGAAVVHFRITAPTSFNMVYSGSKHIDLTNERMLLSDTGLEEGDLIVLHSRREREEEGKSGDKDQPAAKVPRTESNVASQAQSTATSSTAPTDPIIERGTTAMNAGIGAVDPQALERILNGAATQEDMALLTQLSAGDGESLAALLDAADEGDEEGDEHVFGNAPDDLYDRLLDSVDNLVDMRQRFIQDPEGILKHIQDKDPTLYQLIAANMEEFLELVNNEELVKTLQEEKEMLDEEEDEEGGVLLGDDGDDEELSPEQQAALQQAFIDYVGQQVGPGDGVEERLDGPVARDGLAPENIDQITPTADEEEKIQSLVQLGFTYKQCKSAFYKCRRSIERAANMLFESPPEV
eukprot:gene478-258_t